MKEQEQEQVEEGEVTEKVAEEGEDQEQKQEQEGGGGGGGYVYGFTHLLYSHTIYNPNRYQFGLLIWTMQEAYNNFLALIILSKK